MHPEIITGAPALVALPEHLPAPAVVWLHGLGADALANAAELERLAAEGFVAVGLDAVGHGRRRRPDLDAVVAAPRDETLRAMRAMVEENAGELPGVARRVAEWPEVLVGQIAVVGVSMGAFAVYRALARGLDVRAAVALLGDPEWPGERADAHDAELARVPLLSITAERDESVPPGAARALHERLARGHPAARHRHVELAGAPHLMSPDDWGRAMAEAVGWLRGWLAT